jgi:hypothetical protein
MSSRNLWPGIFTALYLSVAALAWSEEPGSSSDIPTAPEAAQTQPTPPPQEPQVQPPNLRIIVEGNRRWCVRTREPIWPSQSVPQPPPRGRRRGPIVTTLAYAYYVFALPESEALAIAAATAPQTTPAEQQGPGATPQTQEAGAPPQTQEAAAGAAGGPVAEGSAGSGQAQAGAPAGEAEDLEEETVGANVQFAAPLQPAAPEAETPAQADLAKHAGKIVLTQSPVYRTMSVRRVQIAGKPPEVKPFWDPGKSCCQFPTSVEAYLPPDRYIVEVSFDVFIRRKGWQHVQMSRRDGVDIKEGEVTELTLRVDTDGYVEVKPSGRVIDFPPAPGATAAPQTPAANPPPPAPQAPGSTSRTPGTASATAPRGAR